MVPQASGPQAPGSPGSAEEGVDEGSTEPLAASVLESETRWPGLTRPRFPPESVRCSLASTPGQQRQQVGGSWEGHPEELPVGGDSEPGLPMATWPFAIYILKVISDRLCDPISTGPSRPQANKKENNDYFTLIGDRICKSKKKKITEQMIKYQNTQNWRSHLEKRVSMKP